MGQYPCQGADSNRRLSSLPLVASHALSRNAGLEPTTLRLTVVCSPFELISRWLPLRGHSVHAVQFTSVGAPAGNSENPSRRMFFAKTLV